MQRRWPERFRLVLQVGEDALLFAAWTQALVRQRVEWRGQWLSVRAGSRLVAPCALPPAPTQVAEELLPG